MFSTIPEFETLLVLMPKPYIYHVKLNRPNKLNAMNHKMWSEIGKCFEILDENENCRVVMLTGEGRMFTAGLDLADLPHLFSSLSNNADVGRRAKVLSKMIREYQEGISWMERCSKPVVIGVHGGCVGGGVDLLCAGDIRYCTTDAWFQVKEVDIGMAADVGTLQRLPRIIGSQSLVRELCFTCRKLGSREAKDCGLISHLYGDRESLLQGLLDICTSIAASSPIAVQGTKKSLIYSRDHTVQEGLDHICMRNELMLQSEDFLIAVDGQVKKKRGGEKEIIFAKL